MNKSDAIEFAHRAADHENRTYVVYQHDATGEWFYIVKDAELGHLPRDIIVYPMQIGHEVHLEVVK